jgi:hypothetical protein
MAPNGHVYAVVACPLLGEERKSLPTVKMTAFDTKQTSPGLLLPHAADDRTNRLPALETLASSKNSSSDKAALKTSSLLASISLREGNDDVC